VDCHIIGLLASPAYGSTRSASYEITSPVERLEESLMRLTEVDLVTNCRFVDSPCSVRKVFKQLPDRIDTF
jgi:hypothetical protein